MPDPLTDGPPPPPPTPLATLEETAADIRSLLRTRRENNYVLGWRLQQMKEQARARGENWTAWFDETVRAFDIRTAQRWMKWAKEVDKKRTWLPTPEENDKVSLSDHWYTPKAVIDAARQVLGHIDLDPATSVKANVRGKWKAADRIYTEKPEPGSDGVDGLKQPWAGRVWCNPPYNRLTKEFVEKAWDAYRNNSVTAILLLNRLHVVQPWFGPMFHFPICYCRKGLRFEIPLKSGKMKTSSPQQGSIFVCVSTPRLWRKFHDVFSWDRSGGYGRVVMVDEEEDDPPKATAADFYPDFK